MKKVIHAIDSSSPKAPAHLSNEAREWWYEICSDWNFEAADLLILESALEAFDRMRQAQVVLKRDGITIKDRYGVLRMHPCVTVEQIAKQTVARLFKALHLNLNPEKLPVGRPPGRR